jgi:peptidoglycan/xylan/chitin deacetylase (PgdA/CDA1 family)
MTISSHSVNHIDNNKLDLKNQTDEMCTSREILEKLIGMPVNTYIYPSGRLNPIIALPTAKKCGYTLAWSTGFGTDYNSHTGSIYAINRTRIFSETDPHFYDIILEKYEKTKER